MALNTRMLMLVCCLAIVAVALADKDKEKQEKKKEDDFDKTGCEWKGTSPFCAGGCVGVNQVVRQVARKGDGTFGADCLTGNKVLCCPGPVAKEPVKVDNGKAPSGCVWTGTSPVCDGGCDVKGHVVREISKTGDGTACVTGNKILCCADPR